MVCRMKRSVVWCRGKVPKGEWCSLQAGEMADGSLGRRGGFIEYRSLLQSHNIRTLLAFNGTQAQPDHQAPPPLPARNETGQGKAHPSLVSLHNPQLKTAMIMVIDSFGE